VEAVRSLFSPNFKADAKNVNAVRDLWVRYTKGDATYDDTIKAIVDLAGAENGSGGYAPPSWVGVRPDSAAAPENGKKSYESELVAARSGFGGHDVPGPRERRRI
jgi:hypothetical protein